VQAVITLAATTAIDALVGNALAADLIGVAFGVLALLFALLVLQPHILRESWAIVSVVMGR
jgi:hypothetical protein